ncbi:MAG: lamin tail domain-containing protein, partial [Treponema sp.]|nr:lamin tail domain-containing protein [Treponema sp.]
DTVVLKWTLDGTSQADISMSASGGVYSAVIPAQADGAEVAYWVSASNNDGDTSNTITQSYTVAAVTEDDEDYSPLILNEISGEHKYVEIYNSGTEAIPLNGVKLQRNDGPTGGSEWTGGPADSIPAGAYRIFLFNTFTPTDKNAPSGNANNNATSEIYTGSSSLVDKTTGLNTYAEFTGWGVNSGISDQQILKIAIVDPDGTEVSVFIRGDNPLPAWGNSTGVTRNQAYSYSRMSDGTWAYAVPTPGAENGTMESAIVTPGYIVSGNLEP